MAAGWLFLTPLIFSIGNLDQAGSALVLEQFVSLAGVMLITPLFLPEQDKEIRELIESKYTDSTGIYLLRILLAALTLLVYICVFAGTMLALDSEFEGLAYIAGTFATAFFMGSLGLLAYAVSNQVTIGYLIPLGWYLFNLFTGSKYVQKLDLFSLAKGSFEEKYGLLAVGFCFVVAALLVKKMQRSRR